jgi:hypothetical protein
MMKTPNQLVEEGIGLIATGLFRANKEHGPAEAADMGSAAVSTIRGMWLDFYKKAAQAEICNASEPGVAKKPESVATTPEKV